MADCLRATQAFCASEVIDVVWQMSTADDEDVPAIADILFTLLSL
jgi:hypothetical protein